MDVLKYRVVASGRIAPEVSINGTEVRVAPPTGFGANTETSPAWLSGAPLPPPLAALACSGSVDPQRWEEVAAQAYQSGGNVKGWTRAGNCDLNGDGSFQWDIKLRRELPPRHDPGDPNLPYNKCKRSRKVLTAMWRVMMTHAAHPALAGLPLDSPKAWLSMDDDELAAAMGNIMSTLLLSGAPAGGASVAEVSKFGELDPLCLALLFDERSASAVRAKQGGAVLQVAPRWTRFPVIELQREVLMRQGGTRRRGESEPVGEKFTITFKNGE